MTLKNNIELHGFDSEIKMRASKYWVLPEPQILWEGKLSEVTEEQAKELVKFRSTEHRNRFKNYEPDTISHYPYFFALESLKSVTDKEWIIITKR